MCSSFWTTMAATEPVSSAWPWLSVSLLAGPSVGLTSLANLFNYYFYLTIEK